MKTCKISNAVVKLLEAFSPCCGALVNVGLVCKPKYHARENENKKKCNCGNK